MDAKPQQNPEPPSSTLPPEGATSVPLPPAPLRTTLRRAAFGAVAGAVLVAGAVVAVPDGAERAVPPRPGPVARAEAAAAAGSPAALSDLTALIGDRQRWVETHPSDAPSWAVLGTAFVEWGRRSADAAYYARAEQALRRSLAVQPGERGNTEAWVGLGALANARHDYLAAKKWGETVRARQPKNWTAYPVLIDAYNGLGEYEAAGKATERFGALRKGVPSLARTAEMYRNQGWREDALATAQEAADHATAPAEKAEALHRLGDLAWERGEPAEALAQYEAALRTDRSHLASRAGRARALAALERTDEALADYRTVTAKLPVPQYVLELGELYESMDLDGDARTQYAQLGELLDRARTAGVNESVLEARYEADHGDPDAAVELMRTEWSSLRRSAAVADALGWALHRAGRTEEGVQYAERAVETGVRDASYAYHLGVIESSLGQDGPARGHLEEALRTNPRFSPLAAPLAREALEELGEPAPGGPEEMRGAEPEPAPSAAASPSSAPKADAVSVRGPGTGAVSPSGPGTAPTQPAAPPVRASSASAGAPGGAAAS
ncbi:lipopolysaccharide assembly protein LapB [Streptomyces sp. B1I3]|uniref:tetratricopeptide repeat protein n=1 Tax=Streptomyces sp. B1I3 TaxID=3042264 RepID=UPI00277D68BF|nr:tetratricopeptide repeat protein [Streptomyces sp. B1I3]MDQ0796121.1 tetratricopeptide (TPR) repeat protein [Streptomyces sp. B1I3]